MLFIGYFEGVSSERGIAWRVADSLSLRSFLDLELTAAAPDHSTLSRTRRRIDLETHEAVFTWILERLSGAGLVRVWCGGKRSASMRRRWKRGGGADSSTCLVSVSQKTPVSGGDLRQFVAFWG